MHSKNNSVDTFLQLAHVLNYKSKFKFCKSNSTFNACYMTKIVMIVNKKAIAQIVYC